MSFTGSYDIKEFLDCISQAETEIPVDDFSSDEVFEIRKLASAYKRTAVGPASSAGGCQSESDLFESIRLLAEEYTRTQRAFSRSAKVRIDSAAALRVAVFRANPAAIILDLGEDCVSFQASFLPHIPPLPRGYGYKGGAARLALAAILGLNVRRRVPRDLDIVRFGEAATRQDERVARRFMPDDLEHGNGVELIKDWSSYMATRDLTINQTVLIDNRVICSYQAVEDTLNRVLRATAHVTDYTGQPQGKITMKMVRMLAESRIEGQTWTIADDRHNPRVTPFDIALHLDRALARGSRAAQLYMAECMERGFLYSTAGSERLGDAIASLRTRVRGRLNQFDRLRGRRRRALPALMRAGLSRSPARQSGAGLRRAANKSLPGPAAKAGLGARRTR